MAKIPPRPITNEDLELFGCPNEKSKCNGFLVPYLIERKKALFDVYSQCYSCNKKYKMNLSRLEHEDWFPKLKKFAWKCTSCGGYNVEIKKAVGNKILKVKITCNDCKTNFKKKIEHDTYDLLAGFKEITEIEEKEEIKPLAEEKQDEGKKEGMDDEDEKYLAQQRQAELYEKAREQHVICLVCGLKVIGEFKGYCPGCGTKFEAV